LVISPAELDFGALSVAADGPGVRSFTVTNAGGSSLTVHGHDEVIDLTDGASEVFTVDAEPYFELEPGEARRLDVTFTAPTEGSWAGQLRVNYGVETVELSGSGRAPVLSVGAVQVPTTPIGCTAAFTLALEGVGSEPLTVTDLALADDGDFSLLSDSIEAPLSLLFHPAWSSAGGGARETTLSFFTNDPLRPRVTVPLRGFSYEGEMVEERFVYAPGVSVDLLVLADTDGVMGAYLDEGQRATDALAAAYEAAAADVHLAVSTGLSSCPPDRTDSLADLSSTLERGLEGAAGPGGGALLAAAAESLANDVPGGCLEGFLRDNTQLHVLVLAGGPDGSGLSAEASLAALVDAAPQATEVVVSAFIPTEASACGGLQYGAGYAEAALRSGGVLEDLCGGDWSGLFDAVAQVTSRTAAGSLLHPLREPPLPESITVEVDGLSFTDWTYDEATQSLSFTAAAAPEAGAIVEVHYMARAACEG
jgi:hypothetical protein